MNYDHQSGFMANPVALHSAHSTPPQSCCLTISSLWVVPSLCEAHSETVWHVERVGRRTPAILRALFLDMVDMRGYIQCLLS